MLRTLESGADGQTAESGTRLFGEIPSGDGSEPRKNFNTPYFFAI